MAGYRFCRSDDIPLLVEAYNACYRAHFLGPSPEPGVPEMTVDAFKRMTRELNLWTSSCMVASAEGRPIGVMLAAKRDGEANWIHSLGILPEFQRQGHGRHLLTSLSQKLAILGPRRMTLELPADAADGRRFVEACGYREEARYTDFVRPAQLHAGAEVPDLLIPVTLAELVETDAFDPAGRYPWRRLPRTLLNVADRLQGLALPSAERIEAFVLLDDEIDPGVRRIVALEAHDDQRRQAMLALLLSACASTTDRALLLSQASPEDLDPDWLATQGFNPGTSVVAYATEAKPG